MKKSFLLAMVATICAIGAVVAAHGPHVIVIRTTSPEQRIADCWARGDYAGALEAIDIALRSRQDDPVLLYNRACAKAKLGQIDEAARTLLDAVRHGFDAFSHMQRDPDLRGLREHEIFRAILDARAFADELLANRRLAAWKERIDTTRYRHERDEQRRLDYLTSLNQARLARVQNAVNSHLDELNEWLFDNPPNQWVLVILPDSADGRALVPERHAHGVYRHHHRELLALDHEVALRHELVHLLHHRHMDQLGQQHPIWIQEGLATLFEHYERAADGGLRFPAGDRQNLAKRLGADNRLLPWREIMAMSDRAFNHESHRTYAQVDAMFRFIAQRSDLRRWYEHYIERFDSDPTGALALEIVFDMPLGDIERAWREWLDRRPFIVTRAPVGDSGGIFGR